MVKTIYEQRTLGVQPARLNQSNAPEQMMQQVENSAIKTAGELYKTADDIYKMDFDIASRRMISDIYSKNPNDPEKLRQEFDEAQKGLLKDASPMQAMELQAKFEYMTMQHLASATQNKLKINNDQLKEKSLERLNFIQNSLEHSALGMLSNDPAIQAASSKSAQADFLSMQETLNSKDSNGNPFFSADQRVSAMVNMRQKMMLYAANEQLKNADDPELAYQQIINGEKKLEFKDPDNNVQASLSIKDDLSVGDLWRLQKTKDQLIKEKKAAVDEQEDANRIRGSLAGSGYIIDPTSKRDADGLNQVFVNEFLPTISNLPPMEQGKATVDFVSKAGVIPSALKGTLATTVRGGSPDQKLYASAVLSGIARQKPQAIEDFSKENVSYAFALNNMVSEGIDLESAIERLDNTFDPRNSELIKKRKNDFEIIKRDLNPKSKIQNIFKDELTDFFETSRISVVPDTSDRLIARFNSIYEDEYVMSGDEDIALQRTSQRLKAQYGISTVGGGHNTRIMKYPPNKFYQLDGIDTKDWLKRDFEDLRDRFLPDTNTSDIYIVDDEQTASEARDERPTYPVIYKNKNGALVPLMNEEGQQVRFAPNVQREINRHNKELEEWNRQKNIVLAEVDKDPSVRLTKDIFQGFSKAADAVDKVKKGAYKTRSRAYNLGVDVGGQHD